MSGEDGKQGNAWRVVLKDARLLSHCRSFWCQASREPYALPVWDFRRTKPRVKPSTSNTAGPVAMSGMAGGAGRAAELLVRHYSMMAAHFPVIEIDAQREVDLLLGRDELEGVLPVIRSVKGGMMAMRRSYQQVIAGLVCVLRRGSRS